MKVSAHFQDGELALLLIAETEAERRMVGAVTGQPHGEQPSLDYKLLSGAITWEGHHSNLMPTSIRLVLHKRD